MSVFTKFKIDIKEVVRLATEAAFGENRLKVNEEGLSPAALEAKKNVIANRTAATLFVRLALRLVGEEFDRKIATTIGAMRKDYLDQKHDKKMFVEKIAVDALARGDGCVDYLERFCEEVRS